MSELLDAIRLCFRHAADAALMPAPQASAA